MADRYYGVSRGDNRATVSSSQTNKDVELIIDDAVGLTKKDIVVALERIKQELLQDNQFTAGG